MRVYLSADIEGVTGITDNVEANPDKKEWVYFKEQMTREVAAACEGAMAAGATEILVKDAHWHGRNIDARALPTCARMVRGWTGHPYCMMTQLDKSFDAVVFVGYHSKAGSGGNPLAHTLSGKLVEEVRINGRSASEFLLNTLTAYYEGIPVVFLSGDQDLCDEVAQHDPEISTFATFKGLGHATINVHPDQAVAQIRERVEMALKKDFKVFHKTLPESFEVELDHKIPREAYRNSFYPGAELTRDKTVALKVKDYFDVLRFLSFAVGL